MKKNIIYFCLILLLFSCRKPLNPVLNEGPLSYTHWGTFNVGGDCLDLDITDSILVAAANYNGFFVFNLDNENHTLDTLYHGTDLDPSAGDNRIEQVIYSSLYQIVFAVDKYDKIWMHKLVGEQYLDNWVPDCYNGVWLSSAIYEKEDGINIISLVKHNRAEADGNSEETTPPFDEYSTSVVWKNLSDIDPSDLFTDSGVPYCEYTYNFSVLPSEIYFSDGLLAVSNGELGVNILKQTDENICVDEDGYILEEFPVSGDYDNDMNLCKAPIWQGGFNGTFEPAGGFVPIIFSSFDTPGEVKTVFSFDNNILAGLSKSNGCFIQTLRDDGSLFSNYSIADGYSVNGIDYDNNLLALACGHDGILIYDWNGSGLPLLLGKISTSYANKIKVNNNKVFVATEDGIDIFELER